MDCCPIWRSRDRIKFFNPLTLTLLPTDEDGYTISAKMPTIVEDEALEDGITWSTLERQGFYRIKWIDDTESYGRLEWNDRRTRLVAIDGQHRLSALKRFQRDEASEGHSEFLSWRIPVVVVSFRSIASPEPPTVLDVVRNIFVYINQQARTINPARAILLSDESVNSVCVQELVQHSHEADTRTDSQKRGVPLLFYDWRGEERDGRPVSSPVAVKSVEEVHNWFSHYILGADFQPAQKEALRVTPVNDLNGAFVDGQLNYDYARLTRRQFQEVLLPAMTFVLENFKPYKDYIDHIRKLERDCRSEGDIGSYALALLRFWHQPGS